MSMCDADINTSKVKGGLEVGFFCGIHKRGPC